MEINNSKITVIIPTTAEWKRFDAIKRAVESIRKSSVEKVLIIASVNGNKFHLEVCEWLKAQPDVIYIYNDIGSAPLAHIRGRELVKTPYFSFLDDDDEYLKHALDIRLKILEENQNVSLVVTNGYSVTKNVQNIHYKNMCNVNEDQFYALYQENWLHNCNHLFRTADIKIELFKNHVQYLEWTWLAFKISIAGLKVVAMDEKTFLYYDTEDSLSKSDAYNGTFPKLAKKMLAMSPPKNIKSQITYKLAEHFHFYSVQLLKSGNVTMSLKYHLKSIFQYRGFKYLLYTRYIIFPALLKYAA